MFAQDALLSPSCCGRHIVTIHLFNVIQVYAFWQGGRTWQPFVGDRNGHESFRQAHIYNFRDKCVVFPCNHKFANLTQ